MSQTGFEQKLKKIAAGPKDPEKEFVLSGATYGHVYDMANAFKKTFIEKGMQNQSVCLCTTDRAVLAAALLACLTDGPTLVLPFADSETVLTELYQTIPYDFAFAPEGAKLPQGVKNLLQLSDHSQTKNTLLNEKDFDPDRAILKLYTGGSTGRPKLWTKTIRNLFSEALLHSETYGISKNDRVVSSVSPCHIYGLLFSVLIPLVSSAGVADGAYTFPDEILSAIKKYLATIFIGVPISYRTLRGRKTTDHSLRLAFSSGGMLQEDDGHDFFTQNQVGVVEVYGSTETGGIGTRCRSDGQTAFTPFAPITWKITEEELYVKSDHVSPDAPKNAEGFYCTGDRASAQNNHEFIISGRTDSLVKVGGKRVDMEEIRDKLNQMPGVEDSAVIYIPVSKGRENVIVAMVQGPVDKAELKASLATMLEPWAMPRSIQVVDEIPFLSTGKIDREKIEKGFKGSRIQGSK